MKLTIIVGFVFPDFVSFPCLDVLSLASFDLLFETRYINHFHDSLMEYSVRFFVYFLLVLVCWIL